VFLWLYVFTFVPLCETASLSARKFQQAGKYLASLFLQKPNQINKKQWYGVCSDCP
jgi:hypothetical protein